MRRYHFHLRQGQLLIEDEEGRDFPSLEAARLDAVRGARAILAAGMAEGVLDLDAHILVTDEFGVPRLVVRFADAVGEIRATTLDGWAKPSPAT